MLKRLIEYIHKYFGFNKRERNGLIILSAIVLILFIVRLILPSFSKQQEVLLTKVEPKAKEEIVEVKQDSSSPQVVEKAKRDSIRVNELFPFDPNTVSVEDAVKLGFSKKTAQTLEKYRSKGGKFKSKEDLKKLYGVSEKLYAKIESYVLIEVKAKPEFAKTTSKYEKPSAKQIDINTADSLELLSLPMVGPATAKKILKFRNSLGGFYSIEQLRELYGMKDSVFTIIQPRLVLSSASVKKLNVNTLSYEEMKNILTSIILLQALLLHIAKNTVHINQ
ncbi:MAG: helix-hairpin-helix domain-containing protein [Bacteroidetes bacterium]|nr:helix-hairpin-helix domain-containing protein [Bacteroidota bacterium]